jgi:hypothetical protein
MANKDQLTAKQKKQKIQDSLRRLQQRLANAAARDEDVLVEVSALLSPHGAERLYGIPVEMLEGWRCNGYLPFVLLGRSIRYRAQDLEDAIERHFTAKDFERLYPLPDRSHNNGQVVGSLSGNL